MYINYRPSKFIIIDGVVLSFFLCFVFTVYFI